MFNYRKPILILIHTVMQHSAGQAYIKKIYTPIWRPWKISQAIIISINAP